MSPPSSASPQRRPCPASPSSAITKGSASSSSSTSSHSGFASDSSSSAWPTSPCANPLDAVDAILPPSPPPAHAAALTDLDSMVDSLTLPPAAPTPPAPPVDAAPRRASAPAAAGRVTKKSRANPAGPVARCLDPRPGQTRYWTQAEHDLFLEAVAEHGEKAYVAISNHVETRTPKQVRTHAQKFQMKMARLAKSGNAPADGAPPPHTRGSGKAAKVRAARAAAAAKKAKAAAAAGVAVTEAAESDTVDAEEAVAVAAEVAARADQFLPPALTLALPLAGVPGLDVAVAAPATASCLDDDVDAYMRYIGDGPRDLEDLEDVAVLATSPFADGGEEWLMLED